MGKYTMVPNYSVVKVRALSEEELSDIQGLSLEYILENFEANGYRVFKPREVDEHPGLKPYMQQVHLNAKKYDHAKMKLYYHVPADYILVKITPPKTKDGNATMVFVNPSGITLCEYDTSEVIDGIFTEEKICEYYITYIEPIASLKQTDGIFLCKDHGITNFDGTVEAGYFPITWRMARDIKENLSKKYTNIFYMEHGERVFFHTIGFGELYQGGRYVF